MKASMISRIFVTLILGGVLASPAWAQYRGPGGTSGGTANGGSSGGSYGSGAAVGVGIGAAAAGAGLIYWATHHKATIAGCVESGEEGQTIQNDADHQSYRLAPGSEPVETGQKVKLIGKKYKDSSGQRIFQVAKVSKNYGSCSGESAANAAPGQEHP